MKCSRCASDRVRWNKCDYLVCFNCGKIIIEPENISEIAHGIMLFACNAKENLWRTRPSGETVNE